MLILYCEYTSHSYWAKTYAKYSKHSVSRMSIDGSNFKWRMQSCAIAFANQFLRTFCAIEQSSNGEHIRNQIEIKTDIQCTSCPAVVVIDDLIDLNLFSAMIRRQCPNIRFIYFLHENQLTIPWKCSDRDRVSGSHWVYGLQNFKSMLGADRIWWNSRFHREQFLEAMPKLIRNRSNDDWTAIVMIQRVRSKSNTVYLPIDYAEIEAVRRSLQSVKIRKSERVILWNARWESDKNPALFLYALRHLQKMKDIAFKLVILGEAFCYSKHPLFAQIRTEFAADILQFGFVESYSEYIAWLSLSDVLVMTSNHEFFGISLMESMHCGAVPVLPNHLVYAEHFENTKYPFLYRPGAKGELVKMLRDALLRSDEELTELRTICKRVCLKYDANDVCSLYDQDITLI